MRSGQEQEADACPTCLEKDPLETQKQNNFFKQTMNHNSVTPQTIVITTIF